MKPDDAFRLSDDRCLWQLCNQRADLRLQRRNAQYCREHALFIWSLIDEEIREYNLSPEELFERQEREEAEAAKREERLDTPGMIYYLRIGPHIKIGWTANLYQRIYQYPPSAELLAVEAGTLRDEGNRHRQFADLRDRGREWYRPMPRLIDYIAVVATNGWHHNEELKLYEMRDTRTTPL